MFEHKCSERFSGHFINKKEKVEFLMKNTFQSSRIAVELERILFTKEIFLVNFFLLLGTCNTSISMSTFIIQDSKLKYSRNSRNNFHSSSHVNRESHLIIRKSLTQAINNLIRNIYCQLNEIETLQLKLLNIPKTKEIILIVIWQSIKLSIQEQTTTTKIYFDEIFK